jgi:uncharacterized protein YegP (UPF0339 family)
MHLIVLTFFLLCRSIFAYAEGEEVSNLVNEEKAFTISHTPNVLDIATPPGAGLTLKVNLLGTTSFDYKLRALVVRDGNFFDVVAEPGTLNSNETPEYTIALPAPLFSMSYFFNFYNGNGELIAQSDNYSVARSCLPQLSLPPKNESEEDNTVRLINLSIKSRVIERHILAFQTASMLLSSIKSVLDKQITTTND